LSKTNDAKFPVLKVVPLKKFDFEDFGFNYLPGCRFSVIGTTIDVFFKNPDYV
jgi:hypothetical protein